MKLEYSTVAQCRAEEVWAVFTDSTRWSEWSPLLSGMQWTSGEPWQAGSQGVIDIPQPSFKLKMAVKESMPPKRVVWTGGAMGVTFECAFDFTPQTENTTLMATAIDLSGAAVFFINNDMKKKGLDTFAAWFESLKAQAEQLAAGR
jgi:hypothetical protein